MTNYLLQHFGKEAAILHAIDIDGVTRLLVVGDPDNGFYEWAIERNGKAEQHSRLEYTISFAALRDGLIEVWSLPRDAKLPADHEAIMALRKMVDAQEKDDYVSREEQLRFEGRALQNAIAILDKHGAGSFFLRGHTCDTTDEDRPLLCGCDNAADGPAEDKRRSDAYPKLVDALRHFASHRVGDYAYARAILKELGEE